MNAPPATAPGPSAPTRSSQAARIESWRVVAEAILGAPATADATIRIRAEGERVIAHGEGSGPADALAAGLLAAEQEAAVAGWRLDPAEVHELLGQLPHAVSTPSATTAVPVRLTAMDGGALLGRLAALLGPHDVERFSYERDGHGRVQVDLTVLGGEWQVDRVVAKLRRVIGVLDVVATGPVQPGT